MKNNALEELKAWADKYNIAYDCWESSINGLLCFMLNIQTNFYFFQKKVISQDLNKNPFDKSK